MSARANADPSRLSGRVRVVARALAHRVAKPPRHRPQGSPRRILIAHHLLLGDTLMLTALLAKLRERFPKAEVVMALPQAYAPLYAGRPYGVRAIGWSVRAPQVSKLWRERGFDLALVPGDNRFSWLAMALDSGWIVAFGGDRPAAKSLVVDERRPYPGVPAAWADMVATLVDGPPPSRYVRSEWPDPPADPFDLPQSSYGVLHVGASTPLKQWDSARWRALAAWLGERGIEPVWSAGRGEEAAVLACVSGTSQRSYAGALELTQLWRLLANATLLVAPDTGVAHLGRVVGVPTVALFGPGSATVSGAGDFWRDAPYRAVTVDPFPCRDQRVLFKREIDWVRRCGRSLAECPHPRCMDAIGVDAVTAAIAELGIAHK
jgi:ADP-heptose:LPS heptosyltransferase